MDHIPEKLNVKLAALLLVPCSVDKKGGPLLPIASRLPLSANQESPMYLMSASVSSTDIQRIGVDISREKVKIY